jgi:hypothetical protein
MRKDEDAAVAEISSKDLPGFQALGEKHGHE